MDGEQILRIKMTSSVYAGKVMNVFSVIWKNRQRESTQWYLDFLLIFETFMLLRTM